MFSSDKIVQYLGIKYASLGNGFADAQICNYDDIRALSGRKHGPSATSPPNACQLEFNLIQKPLPIGEFFQSVTECLNLNITAPAEALSGQSGLPVFVFIHGGGFATGCNAWPQYDHARIVQLSRDLGLPVIGVGINYRMGPLGFMTSKELQDHGIKANAGLRDQQVALKWIQKHVSLFGGDAKRVTCIGESAGAVSIMHQIDMAGTAPLFQQIVNMSGTPLAVKPLPPFVAEHIYETTTNILGLGSLSAAERVAKLATIPASDFVSKLPMGLPFMPVLDGTFLQHQISFDDLLGGSGVAQSSNIKILIGSMDMDASIFGIMLAPKKPGSLGRFTKILREATPQYASEVLEFYGFQSSMSDDEAWAKIMAFANDICFTGAASSYASAWRSTAYQYRFREPNPWEGPYKGQASHVLDVAYLFLNYTEHLTPSQAELAVEFATNVIQFINGKAPFERFDPKSKYVKEYLSKDGEAISQDRPKDKDAVWPALFSRSGYDTLAGVWGAFMAS